MKVVTMGRVVFRPQRGVKAPTSPLLHLAQKLGVLALFGPILQHADAPPISQAKPDNIQRIGRGMLAAPLTAGNGAAGEAADMLDPRHPLTKHCLGRWLKIMLLEQSKGRRKRAAGDKAAAESNSGAVYAQGIVQRTGYFWAAVGLRGKAQ